MCIYCDYCVYHYKSTELVALYTLDIGLQINIIIIMFIVSKALLISSATVIVRSGGAIWLNPFATVLFSVCSAFTVECCVPVLHGCVWYVCCYARKKALL